jgi:hypothetical protein
MARENARKVRPERIAPNAPKVKNKRTRETKKEANPAFGICPKIVAPRLSRGTEGSVAVMVRLERSLLRYTDIVGLFG